MAAATAVAVAPVAAVVAASAGTADEHADGTVGFNVLVGGGLSDGERMASDIDVFIRPDQAVDLCRGVGADPG